MNSTSDKCTTSFSCVEYVTNFKVRLDMRERSYAKIEFQSSSTCIQNNMSFASVGRVREELVAGLDISTFYELDARMDST